MLPAELQVALSHHLGVPASSVTVFARQMREAGHLSKHGRGIYAARMTARDCAMLLCAVVGSAGPAEAGSQVEGFLAARSCVAPSPGFLARLGLDEDGMNAVGAVTRVIEAVRTGDAEEALSTSGISLDQVREALTLSFRITAPVRLTLQFNGINAIEGREFVSPDAPPALPGMRTFRVLAGDALVSLGLALRA